MHLQWFLCPSFVILATIHDMEGGCAIRRVAWPIRPSFFGWRFHAKPFNFSFSSIGWWGPFAPCCARCTNRVPVVANILAFEFVKPLPFHCRRWLLCLSSLLQATSLIFRSRILLVPSTARPLATVNETSEPPTKGTFKSVPRGLSKAT